MANELLKASLKRKGIPYWRIAIKLGVSENTIIRWLRTPINEPLKNQIDNAVSEVEKEGLKNV